MTTPRSAHTLIETARTLLAAVPVDEQRLYETLMALIDDHRYTKAALARELGVRKQQIFRLLASRRPELAAYLPMCGGKASVIEALQGMPAEVCERLRQQFEQGGRPYSQALLRHLKRQWIADGKPVVPDMQAALHAASPRRPRVSRPRDAMVTAPQDDENELLRSLVEPVARGERELLDRLQQVIPSTPEASRLPEFANPHRGTARLPVVQLTAAQARRLIKRLGGDAGLPEQSLQAELLRLSRR